MTYPASKQLLTLLVPFATNADEDHLFSCKYLTRTSWYCPNLADPG